MLSILFIITVISFVIIGKLRSRTVYNLLTLYLLFWCFWILVSLGNPYQLYEVYTSTYLTIFLSLVCFSIGYLIMGSPKQKSKVYNLNMLEDEKALKSLKSKGFLLLQFILFLILFYYYRKYSAFISVSALSDQRAVVFDGTLFGNSYEMLFYTWVITPLLYLSTVLLLSNFIFYRQKSIALAVTLVNCVLFGGIGNGRLIYFDILIYCLVASALKNNFFNGKKIPKWHIKKSTITKVLISVVFFFALIYIMNLTSAKRLGMTNPNFSDLWDIFINYSLQQCVVYFTGGFRALDYFLTSHIVNTTGYTFGRATFAGIEEFFNSALIFITHDKSFSMNTANVITTSFTVQSIAIGNNQSFNAFYTNIMNFYLDFGIAGVVVLSTLYGVISAFVYNFCIKDTNIYKLSLLVYYAHHLIESEFRWLYQAPATWIIIFSLIFMIKRYEKQKHQVNVQKVRKRLKIVW